MPFELVPAHEVPVTEQAQIFNQILMRRDL
jgi:hypothetical protein